MGFCIIQHRDGTREEIGFEMRDEFRHVLRTQGFNAAYQAVHGNKHKREMFRQEIEFLEQAPRNWWEK